MHMIIMGNLTLSNERPMMPLTGDLSCSALADLLMLGLQTPDIEDVQAAIAHLESIISVAVF